MGLNDPQPGLRRPGQRLAAATATHDDLRGHLLALLGDAAAVVTAALARVSRAARPRT